MDSVFLEIIRLSIVSCWFIVTVIAFRGVFRDMPKWVRCVLWDLVWIRLLCPYTCFTRYSRFSLAPDVGRVMRRAGIIYTAGFPVKQRVTIIESIWIVGMAGFLIFAIANCIRIRRRVSEAVRLQGNIYLCDVLQVPFTACLLRPKIYIPSGLSEHDRENVLLHEQVHIRKKDQLWKYLSYITLAVHWFNPLVWAAYLLFNRDLELACDERVVCGMAAEEKKSYAETLLSCSMQRRMVINYFLSFSDVAVKERVESVLSYKRTTKRAIMGYTAACLAIGICFMTKPFPEGYDRVAVNTFIAPSEPTKTVSFKTKAEKNRIYTVNIVTQKEGPYVYMYFDTDYDDTLTEYHVSFDDVRSQSDGRK